MIGYVYRNGRNVPLVPVDDEDKKQQAKEAFRRMYAVQMREREAARKERDELSRVCPHCGMVKPITARFTKCPYCGE